MTDIDYIIPEVELLSYTPNADRLCASAARSTQKKISSSEIYDQGNEESIRKVLEFTIGRGHHSVVEHASFTFSTKGVSRAMTHQKVRHRIGSYSQQSQRYVIMEKPEFIIPPAIKENVKAKKIYDDFLKQVPKAYKELRECGIRAEDARFILPNATSSTITSTYNARSLYNYFRLRADKRHAQWEICSPAYSMWIASAMAAPIIFDPKLFQKSKIGDDNGDYDIDGLVEAIDKTRPLFNRAKHGKRVKIKNENLGLYPVNAYIRKL